MFRGKEDVLSEDERVRARLIRTASKRRVPLNLSKCFYRIFLELTSHGRSCLRRLDE